MVLITGGAYQGKLKYALNITGLEEKDVVDCETCDYESIYSAKILNNFHSMIKRMLLENKDVETGIDRLISENKDVTVIVNELGCGIVPIDKFERLYRETTGRVSCELAKYAKKVYRVVCGLGTVIKDA